MELLWSSDHVLTELVELSMWGSMIDHYGDARDVFSDTIDMGGLFGIALLVFDLRVSEPLFELGRCC